MDIKEDIKPFLDSISLNRFDLKRIDVIAYSSLDGSVKGNEIIQQKRAISILEAIKKYKLQDVETKIITKENFIHISNLSISNEKNKRKEK